ncbi:unnamed protein product [Urochloa decumbens]|uniref:Uncharacterized protein n=1 Tax=Urochloa decumbens TaxID=240449 RepID=A0ABC9A8Q3_9POAL
MHFAFYRQLIHQTSSITIYMCVQYSMYIYISHYLVPVSSINPSVRRSEIDVVCRRFVRVEQSKVPLRLSPGLLVLVEHGEDVCLDGPRALGRALPDMVDKVLVVGLRVAGAGPVAAGRRPAALRHDDVDVPGAGVLQRGVEGVDERVEEVLVRVASVLHDGAGGGEERVVDVDLALVALPGEVGVHVGQQRRAGALQELRDGAHVSLREAALRRREPLGDAALHGGGDLDVAEAGVVEGVVDVLHGGEDVVGVTAGDLVADGDVAEGDAREGLDVVLDPGGGGVGVGGEGAEVGVGHVHDEADVAAAQRLERVGVREVDAHEVDVVGLVELHHIAGRRQAVAVHAVARADGLHDCQFCIALLDGCMGSVSQCDNNLISIDRSGMHARLYV